MKTLAEWHRFLLMFATISLITCGNKPFQIAGLGILILAIFPIMYLELAKSLKELKDASTSCLFNDDCDISNILDEYEEADEETAPFDWDALDEATKDKFK